MGKLGTQWSVAALCTMVTCWEMPRIDAQAQNLLLGTDVQGIPGQQ